MTLKEIADRLGCTLEGDGGVDIQRVAGLEQAGPGDLTFFANPKYAVAMQRTRASAVIVGENSPAAPCAVLRAADPYLAFANALSLFAGAKKPATGVDSLSHVSPDAILGENVSVGPFVSIGARARVGDRTAIYPNVSIGDEVVIGSDCVIHSQVAIRERTRIGDRVIVQNGAVLGADGYGFVTRADGTHQKIPQISIVVIEDDVEIGANTTVDRPAVGETRIQAGAKIDNLVQIGHGVRVGKNTLLAAQVGIAGSTVVGEGVVLGGQVGVAGHIEIGDRARAVGQSGITNSLAPGAFVSGYPAIDNREWLKASVIFRQLPDLRKRIAELEDRVAELEAKKGV
jgi:UDP-3-O-[3-hydroxymyristoyl] glucosamine N-acyltransferase